SAAGRASPQALQRRLRDHVLALPQLAGLVVVDAKGRALVRAGTDAGGSQPAQEDWFRAHREGARDLRVSISPGGGGSIALSRAVTSPNGRFLGAVVAYVDPGYFTRFYAGIRMEPGAQV